MARTPGTERTTRNLLVTLGVVLALVAAGQVWARTAGPPDDLGPTSTGELRGCASGSNCVTSMSGASDSVVAPFECPDVPEPERLELVVLAFRNTGNVSVEVDDPPYAHLVASTEFWGFRDDVELLDVEGIVHVRSQSRLGQGDLGVNRDRVEEARTELASLCGG